MAVDTPAPALPLPAATRSSGASLRARRSPRLVVAGALCAVLGGLGAAAAWTQASHAESVVVMAKPVARGETIASGDLSVVSVGVSPGVRTIPSAQLHDLIGKEALVDLPQGSLVGEGSVGTAAPQKGVSVLGLKLGAGRLPVRTMPAGTRVQLVGVVPKSANASTAPQPVAIDAEVVTAPVKLPDGGTWVMDVRVPEGKAAEVAQLAAADQLVVVTRAA